MGIFLKERNTIYHIFYPSKWWKAFWNDLKCTNAGTFSANLICKCNWISIRTLLRLQLKNMQRSMLILSGISKVSSHSNICKHLTLLCRDFKFVFNFVIFCLCLYTFKILTFSLNSLSLSHLSFENFNTASVFSTLSSKPHGNWVCLLTHLHGMPH